MYFIASSNVHSALLDGFERGKTMGFLFRVAILLRIDSSKIPRMVERPMRIVGLTWSTISGRDLNC